MERYARQISLPEIGIAGQQRLARAAVLVIGAGGLGCPALLYLAAAGVGRIGIVDFDAVDLTNLQRQVLFTMDQVGQNKAIAAAARLQTLNPDIQIVAYPQKLDAQSAPELFHDYDVIIDGTDNFAAKFLLSDAALKFAKPLVVSAIQGFSGQVSVFGAVGGPCYRCLYPTPPVQMIMNCAQAGVIGAVAGLCGVTQAMQAIALIVDHPDLKPLVGRIWTLDAKTMESKIFALPKDPACPLCSKPVKEIILQDITPSLQEIEPSAIDTLRNAVIVDVREQEEWDAGHMPGAVHHALSRILAGDYPTLPSGRPVIMHCQKGMRSARAIEILSQAGFADLYNLRGGYAAWVAE